MDFTDLRDAQLGADFDFLSDNFAVISMSLSVVLNFYFEIFTFGRRIIFEAVKWIFAGVKSAVAQIGLVGFIRFPDFILEASARHILVESFVRFHFPFPFQYVIL